MVMIVVYATKAWMEAVDLGLAPWFCTFCGTSIQNEAMVERQLQTHGVVRCLDHFPPTSWAEKLVTPDG